LRRASDQAKHIREGLTLDDMTDKLKEIINKYYVGVNISEEIPINLPVLEKVKSNDEEKYDDKKDEKLQSIEEQPKGSGRLNIDKDKIILPALEEVTKE